MIELSKKQLWYINFNLDEEYNAKIIYKKVYGYISMDKDACIFIKDFEITVRKYKDQDYYVPMKNVSRCNIISDGIYHDYDVIYCTNENIKDALDFAKDYLQQIIQEEKEILIKRLKKLNSIKIDTKQLS